MIKLGVLGARQVAHMLRTAIDKDQETWKPCCFKKVSSEDDSAGVVQEQRDEMASWLVQINANFSFAPETVALAISSMDRFLTLVKVRPKYLRCVAISCLYIASKTLEEDEVIPDTLDLVQGSGCGCSVAEVCRMERVVLRKLNWDICTPTAVDFLHILHALLLTHHPHLLDGLSYMTPSKQLAHITTKLFTCLTHAALLVHRPVTLALALVSLELEQFTGKWFALTVALQSLVQVDSRTLICCREQAAQCLDATQQLYTDYIFTHTPVDNYQQMKTADAASDVIRNRSENKSTKRKVEHVDEDDIYDSIKRLFSDENPPDDAAGMNALRTSCGSEMVPDSEDCVNISTSTTLSQVQTVVAN